MNVLLIHKNRKLKTMKDYMPVNICSVMPKGMRIARCEVFLGYIDRWRVICSLYMIVSYYLRPLWSFLFEDYEIAGFIW